MSNTEPLLTRRNLPSLGAADQLRGDGRFRRYWLANAVSTAGSSVSIVALPVLMFQRTGSALLTGLLETVSVAPYVLLGLFAGALADRIDRRRLMIGCQLGRAVAVGSIPLTSALGVLTVAQLFVAATLSAILFVGFDAAQFGAIPALFGRTRVIAAMTALGSVDYALYAVGTAVGGLLVTTLGTAPAIGLDAASFAASGVLLTGIHGSFGDKRHDTTTSAWRQLRSDIGEGVSFLWNHRLMRALTLAGFAAALTGGAVIGLLVVLAVRQLGLSDDDARIGLMFSAGSAGALVATLLIPRLTRRFDIPRLNLVTRTASLLLIIGLAVLRAFIPALIVYVAFSMAELLAIRSALSFRQLNTPDNLQCRVNVIGRMIAVAGQPIGAALGGAIAQVTNVQTALLVMSLGLATSTFGGWLGRMRARRR